MLIVKFTYVNFNLHRQLKLQLHRAIRPISSWSSVVPLIQMESDVSEITISSPSHSRPYSFQVHPPGKMHGNHTPSRLDHSDRTATSKSNRVVNTRKFMLCGQSKNRVGLRLLHKIHVWRMRQVNAVHKSARAMGLTSLLNHPSEGSEGRRGNQNRLLLSFSYPSNPTCYSSRGREDGRPPRLI